MNNKDKISMLKMFELKYGVNLSDAILNTFFRDYAVALFLAFFSSFLLIFSLNLEVSYFLKTMIFLLSCCFSTVVISLLFALFIDKWEV